MKIIPPADIVAFKSYETLFPIRTDVVYAKPDHAENHFGQIYHPDALMQGHRDLVKIVLLAAKRLHQAHGWTLIVKDCLRPIEAQQKMIETPIVKANPHWLVEPRFLSGPGQGGHPRGMAVDLGAEDAQGSEIDFGTPFDYFSASTDKDKNPAHREYPSLADDVMLNRRRLEEAMAQAAADFSLPMLALPQEWWDFRFPSSYTNEYAPISDEELLSHQKMMVGREATVPVPDEGILEDLSRFVV